MITKQDRYRGALVGVLAGDALLAPYETWTADAVKADLEKRGGLVPFDYRSPWKEAGDIFPMGRPTDDSDQTAALAESLIANRGLNEEDLFNRLRKITFGHVSPLWIGKAFGAGKNTRNALRPLTFAESKARPHVDEYPSNGALMRSAPLALHFGAPYALDYPLILRMGNITHRHPDASECAFVYIGVLTCLLIGQGFPLRLNTQIPGVPRILNGKIDDPLDPGKWPERGAASFTLHVALWSLLNATDFRDGLTKVAEIGGDTDTYGAVAGGLLGAKFGVEGIPKEWRDVLLGYEKMISLADHLYDIAHS